MAGTPLAHASAAASNTIFLSTSALYGVILAAALLVFLWTEGALDNLLVNVNLNCAPENARTAGRTINNPRRWRARRYD